MGEYRKRRKIQVLDFEAIRKKVLDANR